MLKIREGQESDLPEIRKLVVELAVYEKEPDAVQTTVESMAADGFGERPVFGCIVALWNETVVGVSIHYDRYSTWRGRCLYLEDLIVTQSHRGKGIGKALFERTVRKACDDGYYGMSWQVLDWNEPAIGFYQSFQTQFDEQWINCQLSREQLLKLASQQ